MTSSRSSHAPLRAYVTAVLPGVAGLDGEGGSAGDAGGGGDASPWVTTAAPDSTMRLVPATSTMAPSALSCARSAPCSADVLASAAAELSSASASAAVSIGNVHWIRTEAAVTLMEEPAGVVDRPAARAVASRSAGELRQVSAALWRCARLGLREKSFIQKPW